MDPARARSCAWLKRQRRRIPSRCSPPAAAPAAAAPQASARARLHKRRSERPHAFARTKKFRRPMYRHAASNYGLPGELERYRPSTPTTARCTEHDPAVVGPVGGGAAAVADNPSLRRNGGCAEVDTGQWHPPRTRLVSSHLRSVQSNKIARRHRTPLANLRPALPAGQDRALVSRA